MKNLTDYIAEAYEYNYNISNVPKYTSTGTDKVGKANNKTNYTVQPKNKNELSDIITNAFKNKQYDLNFIDTSNITDMSWLFEHTVYDFDISNWDVSNVTNMYGMLYKCKTFNCDLSNWDVSNVKDISNMFVECYNFNADLSNWNVSNVTNMESMFFDCYKFTGKGLENWDVSNVKNMSGMFNGCTWLNIDFSKWDVSNVTDMHTMFRLCSHFTGFGLNTWDISNVDNMREMFYGDIAIKKQYIENWDPIAIAKKPIYDRLTATSNMFSKSSIQKSTPKWYKKLCKD